MSKPRLLDLFCGAGGIAKGYQRAGFHVVGVDIEPQPHYCGDEFHQTDALGLVKGLEGCWHVPGVTPMWCLGYFHAVHASPPCQAHTDLQKQNKRDYPELIEPTRELLVRSGLPYVIENVEGAPLRDPILLCGTMFPGLRVLRHRLFESNFETTAPQHHSTTAPSTRSFLLTISGRLTTASWTRTPRLFRSLVAATAHLRTLGTQWALTG